MSFNSNNHHMIHRSNYEEFFILYMDNELSAAERTMVEAFVAANPDLKTELDLLMSTRLPGEQFFFDKEAISAESMKRTTIDEDLLLYIDNELPAPAKNIIELELAANTELRKQHDLLIRARLDPSEIISFPEKATLYRTEKRIAFFRPWMRAAAVLVLVAGTGSLLVLNSPPPIHSGNGNVAGQPTALAKTPETKPSGTVNPTKNNSTVANTGKENIEPADQSAKPAESTNGKNSLVADASDETRKIKTGQVATTGSEVNVKHNNTMQLIEHTPLTSENITAFTPPLENKTINNSSVTNILPERSTSNTAATEEVTASKDRKGSLKGFLRKATRVIEKRTGIQPANEDGELLIGMVAVKLK